jgi:prophage regulatory protein
MTTPKKPRSSPVVLRMPEVLGYCGLGPTVFRELVESGDMPKPIKISERGRALAWLRSELDEWLASRVAARDKQPWAPRPTRADVLRQQAAARETTPKAVKPKKRRLKARRAAPAAGARA